MRSNVKLATIILSSIAPLAFYASAVAQAPSEAPPDAAAPERFSIHGQFTNVTQYHPSFTSPYQGTNSLDGGGRAKETVDLTLFLGARLWQGAAFFVNPEVDQGSGLSDTLGVAGFPSGEAYKVGATVPYVRVQRAFFRQDFSLGGATQTIEPDANQLGGTGSSDNVIFRVGKFPVTDIFDTNTYAHDPRSDFLNWAIVDAGAFDYAADAWGYTYGTSIEWTQSWWTVRFGAFDLSKAPNGTVLEKTFAQYALITELEARHDLYGRPGKFKILVFDNRGRMANYRDAVWAAQGTGNPPAAANVRQFRSRPGLGVNVEQEIIVDLGAFARGSINDGRKEAFEFTEINRSISGGLSLKGTSWNRPGDTFALAGVVNDLSKPAREYFAAGGLGILIGDGQLPRYGLEQIVESYYSLRVVEHMALGLDYQYVINPAYNRDRGPVSVFGLRLHAEF